MDSQLNSVDVSELAGVRREPSSRVAPGRGAERRAEGAGAPSFLAILLQGLADEQSPPPAPQQEGSGSDNVPADGNEKPVQDVPSPVSEQPPTEQTPRDTADSAREVPAREAPAQPEKAEEVAQNETAPNEGKGGEAVTVQEETERPDVSLPSPRLPQAPLPEQGEPAEPQARTPQHIPTAENAEATETHVQPLPVPPMATDKAPETPIEPSQVTEAVDGEATETEELTLASKLVGKPPTSDVSPPAEGPPAPDGPPASDVVPVPQVPAAPDESSPKETETPSEPKQPVEPLTSPADGRPLAPIASRVESVPEAAAETKPSSDDTAAEQLREGSEHVPAGPQETRPDLHHLPETSRDMTHGFVDAAVREPVVASGEPEQPLPNAVDAGQPGTTLTTAPSADAVSSVESLAGGNTAGGESQQGDAQQHDVDVSARNSSGPQADSTPEAEVADRLDSVFKQVLSTARLPVDLRQRIELARSIGQQVVRNAAVSVRNGQTHVQLQLRPPSLGTVRMHLTTENQTVSARMVVESEVVRQAVEQHVQHLRSVLRDEGYNLDRFEVAVRTQADADPWASAHPGSDGRSAGHTGGGNGLETAAESGEAASGGTEAVPVSTHDGIVDYLA